MVLSATTTTTSLMNQDNQDNQNKKRRLPTTDGDDHCHILDTNFRIFPNIPPPTIRSDDGIERTRVRSESKSDQNEKQSPIMVNVDRNPISDQSTNTESRLISPINDTTIQRLLKPLSILSTLLSSSSLVPIWSYSLILYYDSFLIVCSSQESSSSSSTILEQSRISSTSSSSSSSSTLSLLIRFLRILVLIKIFRLKLNSPSSKIMVIMDEEFQFIHGDQRRLNRIGDIEKISNKNNDDDDDDYDDINITNAPNKMKSQYNKESIPAVDIKTSHLIRRMRRKRCNDDTSSNDDEDQENCAQLEPLSNSQPQLSLATTVDVDRASFTNNTMQNIVVQHPHQEFIIQPTKPLRPQQQQQTRKLFNQHLIQSINRACGVGLTTERGSNFDRSYLKTSSSMWSKWMPSLRFWSILFILLLTIMTWPTTEAQRQQQQPKNGAVLLRSTVRSAVPKLKPTTTTTTPTTITRTGSSSISSSPSSSSSSSSSLPIPPPSLTTGLELEDAITTINVDDNGSSVGVGTVVSIDHDGTSDNTTTTTTTTATTTTTITNGPKINNNNVHNHHHNSLDTMTISGQFRSLLSSNVFAYVDGNNETDLFGFTRAPIGDMYFKAEMQRYDGWYNNLAHPSWGTIESHLTRKVPASYSDGVYMMAGEDRPSARLLSQALMRGDDGVGSSRSLTALFAFFGQVVSSEILMASEPGCPIEMHRIKIEKCDEMFDRDCRGGRTMPFHRAMYDQRTGQSPNNPREQLNMVTSWIDGSFIYSTSETWLNAMRTFENGSFKTDPSGLFPPRNKDRVPLINSPPAHHLKMVHPERMFLLGDARTNQNPVILALGVIMFRWHNVLAARVQAEHPDWSDEDVFQRTRRLVIASLQNIIMYEYLETLFDEPMPAYEGYNPDIHPGVSHVFQSAAFRFGHTMIPPGLYRRDAECNFLKTPSGHDGIRLCSTWWDAVDILPNAGLEELIMGLSSQIAEREDSVLCSDVRDKLFGPLDFSRRDLAALNIMRGRDNGLPDYNTIRKYFDFPPVTNWSQINPQLYEKHPELFDTLAQLYDNNLDNIDVYVGGMVESELDTGRPGPLFRAIIKEQFVRLRNSDRFWFENIHNGIFSPEEIDEIRKIKLWDIIVNSTTVEPEAVQKDIFLFRPGDPCPQPRQMTSKNLENCLILAGWNYFHGSELPYILVILLLIFLPMAVAVSGYGVIKLNNRRRRKIKQQREITSKKNYDKLYVREWLHHNHKRYVKVKIGPDQSVSTVNRKGETLRRIDIHHETSSLLVEVSQDSSKPMILIRPPRDHDLVLQFDSNGSRKKFLTKLESFLLNHKKTLEIIHTYRDVMLANAETKERRQKRLEHFFREAYALTFGLKPGEKRKFEDVSNDVIMVMRTSLSKKEFAEALGMKPDSLFVKQMFNCVDKDHDGRISFQEFLDTVVLFSRGKTDSKLRIIFDMCDHDGNGVIDKIELTKMLRSLVDIAKTDSMTENEVLQLIEGMFASAGLEDKEELTYDDFKLMMSEYRGDLIAIGLDCKGAKQNFLDTSTNIARMTSFQINPYPEPEPMFLIQKWNQLITYLEENRQPIVYMLIFFVTTIVLFLERFITYSYLSEHTDLRHVMGYGIAVTRGSAASLSFCYSLLLLTMCRNLMTKIRELPIHQYIPLDSHVQFHKIIALTGLFFTVVHTIGHCINFYHVSTQPVEHLRCLTKELQFESDSKPTFSFWIFGTITGLTGIILVLIVSIIFIFAHPKIRQKAYNYFWTTHSLYILMYLFTFIHGLAKLTGPPRFWLFFIGPCIVFVLDKIVSLQTKFMELDILETELLPSDVTKVKFSRPPNFKYLSGQWIRLSCTAFRANEYHSLTLTSAPHENYLSVHVKAQGPWTWKLRNYFDPNNLINVLPNSPPPKIRLEGPFGGGNQDWYKYEVAVMVGGGIGVTPYASILNDLVFGTSTNRYSGVACKKVYFLWICPSHRHFEWFIDVLRDVERKDVTQVLEVHIFITQFFHKFDLRTTMLYICENHFQRISNRSMFTGLKAINHFGRPDMIAFLKFVQTQHSYVSKVGVFSCGPSAMTKSISKACETVNNRRKLPYFIHQFENFG